MIRSFKLGAAILALLLASASWAAFPDKPIRVVIGFPAGGPLDQHARLLLERLGSAPAVADLMAGQVQFMAESIPQAASYHKQGKVRALAVTSRERNPALPDIPTVIESGLKGFEVVGFYGFLAPANLPKDITAKLSDAFRQVLFNPEIRKRMSEQGADPAFLGSEDFAKFLAAEMPKWASAVSQSGARLD